MQNTEANIIAHSTDEASTVNASLHKTGQGTLQLHEQHTACCAQRVQMLQNAATLGLHLVSGRLPMGLILPVMVWGLPVTPVRRSCARGVPIGQSACYTQPTMQEVYTAPLPLTVIHWAFELNHRCFLYPALVRPAREDASDPRMETITHALCAADRLPRKSGTRRNRQCRPPTRFSAAVLMRMLIGSCFEVGC